MSPPREVLGAWIEVERLDLPAHAPREPATRRSRAETGYQTSFVEQYLLPLLYPAGLTREGQWLLAAVVIAVNGGVYTLVLRRHRRRSAGHASATRPA